jgi:diguanylate cyclase (GGDEF)-like protein
LSAATANTRRAFLGAAAAAYAGGFAAFVLIETPGLGLGHFFYLPIILIALATDEAWGALTGALTAGLYVAAIELTPRVPSAQALTASMGIRLVTFTLVGAIIGFFASRNRQLVDRLTDLAGRDFVTGLGNARTFDDALARFCGAGKPFMLFLADIDQLKEVNDVHGHAAGNAALRRVGEVLRDHAEANDVIARIGGDEFALLTRLPLEQIAALYARVNRRSRRRTSRSPSARRAARRTDRRPPSSFTKPTTVCSLQSSSGRTARPWSRSPTRAKPFREPARELVPLGAP